MTTLVRPLEHALHGIELLLRLGYYVEAQQAVDAIGQIHPDLQALHMFRAWLWMAQDQPARAVIAFRLAAGRDPLDPATWAGIAATSSKVDERTDAADRAKLLSVDGPHAQLWHDLRSGKAHLAVTPLQALHRRFPERAELAIWFAEIQRRLGNETQAMDALAPLLRRRPRAVPALFLATTLTCDPQLAAEYLHDALRIDPLAASGRRLFAPEQLPFNVPASPLVRLPASVLAMLDALLGDGSPISVGVEARPHQQGSVAKQANTTANSAPASPTVAPTGNATAYDSDTAGALNAVQQATQRLFKRTPLTPEARQITALLVTHRGALEATYGAAATGAIIEALDAYGAALVTRGVQAERVIVDDRAELARFGNVSPAAEGSSAACKQVIDAVRGYIETSGQDVDAVIVIGGDRIIPFHRLTNPSQDADNDVPSDNPYGCGAGSELAPELVVARFPDGGADGGAFLIDHLQRAADYHQHWHLTGPQGGVLQLPLVRRLAKPIQTGSPVASWGLSTASWQLPSQSVYAELGSPKPIVLCPPATPQSLQATWPNDGRILYFNLHGIQGGPNWYGEAADGAGDAPLPIAFAPGDIGTIASNAICFSEACYGAEIIDRSSADAVALRLLQQGALAFVGSTVTAYGAVTLPLGGADLLVQQTFQNLRRGYPLGRAVAMARDWMAREMVERQGYLDPDDAKTLLSFVILGDPWATPYTRPVLGRKASLPQMTPIVVQRRPVAANMVAPAAMTVARQLIAKVAPQLASARLSAVGQGRPDRIAKGQASAVVFSASDARPTSDGQTLAQIARVTVAGGEARKILLSR